MSLLQRVRQAIRQHSLFSPGEKVVVGVSGGPDSLALLHILHTLSPELGIQLHVAHLNHQLRGVESEEDAKFVTNLALELHLPAAVKAFRVAEYAKDRHLSLEEAARLVRYRFLAETAMEVGAHTVAVAHNADDQVETILMHFLRGAGLAGLRGMAYKSQIEPLVFSHQPSGEAIQVVRPLLDETRAEIEAYCLEHELHPRFDLSNLDTTLYRNRLRHEVIPYLEQLNPNLREVLRSGARAIADDYDYMHAQVEETFTRIARAAGDGFVFNLTDWRAFHPALQRATLREAVRRLRQGLRNLNWHHVEDARRVALEGETGAEATLPQGLRLVVGYNEFTIGQTPNMPDIPLLYGKDIRLGIGATEELPQSGWSISFNRAASFQGDEPGGGWTARLDADKIRGELVLRTRRPGERFEPSGLGGRHKSLHELMIDEKIPRHIRDLLPILADDEKVLWVCGYRVDERAKVTEETTRVVRVEFFKNTAIM